MKKTFKFSALLLAVTIMFSSCIGSFSLTSRLKNWNDNLGSKWANELVFVCLNVIPVYSLTVFVDGLVLNSIEFWTGNKPLASNVGETNIVKNSAGEDVQVTVMENGYNFSNGEQEVQLVFDEAEKSWSAVYGSESVKLMKFIDDNNVQMFGINGQSMNVSLDEAGVNAARMLVLGDYAMSK